jgi:hypothetical protein
MSESGQGQIPRGMAYHHELEEQQLPNFDPPQVAPSKLGPHRPDVDIAARAPVMLKRKAKDRKVLDSMVVINGGVIETPNERTTKLKSVLRYRRPRPHYVQC